MIGRSQGWCDSPLSETGIAQAKQTAERFVNLHLDRAFSSSTERAYDTAVEIVKRQQLPIVRLKGLREMFFGSLEGSQLGEENDMARCWREKDFTSFGGENKEQFITRIQDTFEWIIQQCEDNDQVLIVAHNGYFFYMMEALFGYSLQELEAKGPTIMAHLVPNASTAVFTYEDGCFKLEQLPSKEGITL